MNFFEHQDRARRQTRILILLFSLAVLAVIVSVNAVLLLTLGASNLAASAPGTGLISANWDLIAGCTIVTGAVIGLASLYRSLQLRAGGGDIARSLGGTAVEANTDDPLRRRLYNVVEEMAIASGVPVPEVYVLEHEQGINAFAAGFSTTDAAVAVTRGTLEHLDRDELQGVIAHEFSHIFNGDMRLNIRLIGFLFGILILAIVGRKLLFSARYARDSRNAAPAVMIGLVVVVIGYVGLFFGRWIKAAVSRRREFLADASAVQFTRHPQGIAGALRKIGALYASSFMTSDAEEIGHMLFAKGMGRQMFATHPPLEDRILALDPSFKSSELKDLAAQMDRHAQARLAEAEKAAARVEASPAGPGGLPLNPDQLAEQIGNPDLQQILMAAVLAGSMPSALERAAHSDEWAQEVICFLLLSHDPETRERQQLLIAKALGSQSEHQVSMLWQEGQDLPRAQRLPLLEMAFPSLRRRPQREWVGLLDLINDLVAADGQVDVFEYALGRLTASQIEVLLHPDRFKPGGSKRLADMVQEVCLVVGILARHGHPDDSEAARSAFLAGLKDVVDDAPMLPAEIDDWATRLDQALRRLDQLRLGDKQRLITALARCAMNDAQVVDAEFELLRVIAGLMHVPLPLMTRRSHEDTGAKPLSPPA
ncbi:MAG TPA: M48 family metallopeptidase [Wenzhouxiangella sp.]|nr:M48 family metallopeptidase [Wenzhouxiangella sp.]